MAGKSRIVCFELIILSLICYSVAFFNIEELKNFNYGIDISNEPVVMKPKEDTADSNTIQLTSKFGQAYQCDFPNTVEQEKQKEEAEKEAMEMGIPDLLKPMETSPCLKKTKDWWSYEFCYGKHIRQYHLSEDGRIDGAIIILGQYESEYNWGDDSEKTEAEKQETRLLKYHTQQYVNGSKCDLSGKLRRTEVRFLCEDGSGDYIARLDEPETCVYILTIHTTKICHHPFLKPPTPTRTITITCNPVLNVVQYQEYLDQIEAEEKRKIAKEEEITRVKEENRKIAEQKAKYFKNNQLKSDGEDDDDDVEVAEEDSEEEAVRSELLKQQEKLMEGQDVDTEGWSSIMKAVHKASYGGPVYNILKDCLNSVDPNQMASNLPSYQDGIPTSEMKPMMKVVNTPDELREFMDEAMKEVKKLKQFEAAEADAAEDAAAEAARKSEKDADDEEEDGNVEEKGDDSTEGEEEETGSEGPTPAVGEQSQSASTSSRVESSEKNEGKDEEELSDIEELDTEIKTLKERYRHRRDKLKALKTKVRSSMEEQYANIIKEAQEEVGGAPDVDDKKAVKELSKTLDGLLEKLDRTEKEIANVDKELEQFAEYDEEDSVKTIPPVKEDDPPEAQGPSKTSGSDRVKVRVRRIRPSSMGQTQKASGDGGSETRTEQTAAIEKSVQKELEKAGFGEGDKIQVRIITAGYYDTEDDSMHVLSDTDSETFKNLIVNIIGGTSEADKEAAKHVEQEENYSFVWGKDRQTDGQSSAGTLSGTNIQQDSQTDTQTDAHTDTHIEDDGS